ncbi:MAG: STAS domain-containing protein [Phycisphaerae bacterium]|nr:STAS domain-containing protein [Phycisphaerae bacterium]
MPPSLQIQTESIANGMVLRPSGEIDLARSPELRLRLREEVDALPRRLVIDLSAVGYMDSSGVATLVEALQRSKTAGCRLILCCLQPKVRSIFAISRLDTVFEIALSVDDAKTR